MTEHPVAPQPTHTSPQPVSPFPSYASPGNRGDGLAIIALVTALLAGFVAFLALVVAGCFLVGSSAFMSGPMPGDPFFEEPMMDDWSPRLSGEVRGVAPGTPLEGDDLADEVSEVIESEFDFVESMECPDTASVAKAVVTVCHGEVGGDDSDVVVYFEDGGGEFTLDLH